MSFIVDNLNPSDRRIQLGFECFIRTMYIGTNWQRIRVGYRCAINDTLANIPTVKCVVGVSQGTVPFTSYAITDFIGTTVGSTSYATGATFTRLTQSGVTCANPSAASSIRKQGEIVTQGPSGSSSVTYVSLQPGLSHSVQALSIAKNGTTYQMAAEGSSTGADVTRSAFLAMMEQEAQAPIGMSTMSSNAITGSLVNIYDTVQICWFKSLPTIEISDVLVARYY